MYVCMYVMPIIVLLNNQLPVLVLYSRAFVELYNEYSSANHTDSGGTTLISNPAASNVYKHCVINIVIDGVCAEIRL